MDNGYKTVISYQTFVAKYLRVFDLILHGLLITQKQPPEVFCKKGVQLSKFHKFQFPKFRLRKSFLKRGCSKGIFLWSL